MGPLFDYVGPEQIIVDGFGEINAMKPVQNESRRKFRHQHSCTACREELSKPLKNNHQDG